MGALFPPNMTPSVFGDVKNWLAESRVHQWIGILIGSYVVQTVVEVIGWLTSMNLEKGLLTYVALPAWDEWDVGQVWTLLSYGFLHYGITHLLLNGVMLYFAGNMLKTFWSDVQVSRLFLVGILAGGLAFTGVSLGQPQWTPLMGASAGVLALLMAATRMSPHMPVYLLGIFKVPLWVISVLLLFFSVVGISGPNGGGQVAHLGGALAGWLVGRAPEYLSWTARPKSRALRRGPLHVVRNGTPDLDAILEKVSRVGYAKLTAQEKEYLKRYGQN